jgi:hypothetical protein
MDEHLAQGALNYYYSSSIQNIFLILALGMVNHRNLALAYYWGEWGLDTVRMQSERDNEINEEATSPEFLMIEEEESIWAKIPAVGAISNIGIWSVKSPLANASFPGCRCRNEQHAGKQQWGASVHGR